MKLVEMINQAITAKVKPIPRLDAELIAMHVLNKERSFLYAMPEYVVPPAARDQFISLTKERGDGMPLAYITGTKSFWNLNLLVNKATLIPRPDTELLVELTLKLLPATAKLKLLDLGTGSGAVALAIASERPHWEILAVDITEAALDIARENAARLAINNVKFLQSDWFARIPPTHFDAIVANPPYIAANDKHLQNLTFEPYTALVAGENGYQALADIIKTSGAWLKPEGLLLLEHGYQQQNEVQKLFGRHNWRMIQSWQDLTGNDRVTGGYIPEKHANYRESGYI